MGKGGFRLNAGRKKGSKAKHTLEAEAARQVFIAVVVQKIKPIAKALAERAMKGDVQAARVIFERVWGQVTQEIDLTTKGKSLISTPEKKKIVEHAIFVYLNDGKEIKSEND